MKKIATITLAIILAMATVSCAAEAKKDAAPAPATKSEQAQPLTSQQLQQNLQVQRATIALRIEGAQAAKAAVEKIILDGQVALTEIDKQLAAAGQAQAGQPAQPKPDKVQGQEPQK